jgi:hypothetical protein
MELIHSSGQHPAKSTLSTHLSPADTFQFSKLSGLDASGSVARLLQNIPRMIRLHATQSFLNIMPAHQMGDVGTVARVLCSARESAVTLEPHPNAISHRPDWLHLTVEGVRSSNPSEENLSLSGCRRKL